MSLKSVSVVYLVHEIRRRLWAYVAVPAVLAVLGLSIGLLKAPEYRYAGLIETRCISANVAAAQLSLYAANEIPLGANSGARIVLVKHRLNTIELNVQSDTPEQARKGLDLAVDLILQKSSRDPFVIIAGGGFATYLKLFDQQSLKQDFLDLVTTVETACAESDDVQAVARLVDAVPAVTEHRLGALKLGLLGLTAGVFISFLWSYATLILRLE